MRAISTTTLRFMAYDWQVEALKDGRTPGETKAIMACVKDIWKAADAADKADNAAFEARILREKEEIVP